MGIGIRNYMTDLADDITIQALTDITESQIKQYLPTSDIKSVEYKVNTAEGDRNKLYLIVYLNETADEFQSRMFALGINDSLVRKTDVISDIYM
jgi:predicted ATP-dependent Lon-type protease